MWDSVGAVYNDIVLHFELLTAIVRQISHSLFLRPSLETPLNPICTRLALEKIKTKHIGDPLEMIQVHRLLEANEAMEPKWDKAIKDLLLTNPNPTKMTAEMQATLRRVPLNPALRLAGKPKDQAVAVK